MFGEWRGARVAELGVDLGEIKTSHKGIWLAVQARENVR